MSMPYSDLSKVPEETARVARKTFRKGNRYLRLRDEFGVIYQDGMFAGLFAAEGRPAQSPGRLALVTVMQYADGLSDRAAAEAVQARIDWKYALGLALDDEGFDASVLCEFRQRLIAGGKAHELLDALLRACGERGWLKARGRQRTDTTHVLAAIREINRLEVVGETLRQALNHVAVVAPAWLRRVVESASAEPDWQERYGSPIQMSDLPDSVAEREAWAVQVGQDGVQIWQAILSSAAVDMDWLRRVPAVETLRRVWVQQYWQDEAGVHWRNDDDLPPCDRLIQSPYDVDARYTIKRDTAWTGYKVAVTETCDDTLDSPHLITHVHTTPADIRDVEMIEPIHAALTAKDALPSEHLVDAGFVDAGNLVHAHTQAIDLIDPAPADTSWQAQAGQGFDVAHFVVDWDAQNVTCPAPRRSPQSHLDEAVPSQTRRQYRSALRRRRLSSVSWSRPLHACHATLSAHPQAPAPSALRSLAQCASSPTHIPIQSHLRQASSALASKAPCLKASVSPACVSLAMPARPKCLCSSSPPLPP